MIGFAVFRAQPTTFGPLGLPVLFEEDDGEVVTLRANIHESAP